MKTIISTMAAFWLVGCAAPAPVVWTRSGATEAEFNQDRARCDYETSSATQSTDPGMRSIFGQELDRAMRKNELYGKCMVSKGWSARPR